MLALTHLKVRYHRIIDFISRTISLRHFIWPTYRAHQTRKPCLSSHRNVSQRYSRSYWVQYAINRLHSVTFTSELCFTERKAFKRGWAHLSEMKEAKARLVEKFVPPISKNLLCCLNKLINTSGVRNVPP